MYKDGLLQKVEDIISRKLLKRVQASFSFHQNRRDQRIGRARGKHTNYTLWTPKQHWSCTRLQVQSQRKFSQFQKCLLMTTAMESSPKSCVISVTTTFGSFITYYTDRQLANENHHSSAGCTCRYFRNSFVSPLCFSPKLSRSWKQSHI